MWTLCSARAPATLNTLSTRCVCVRAASSTCPPPTAPPPARPPTVCVYGAENGQGAAPDTRKAFLFLLLPFIPSSFLSSVMFTSSPQRHCGTSPDRNFFENGRLFNYSHFLPSFIPVSFIILHPSSSPPLPFLFPFLILFLPHVHVVSSYGTSSDWTFY